LPAAFRAQGDRGLTSPHSSSSQWRGMLACHETHFTMTFPFERIRHLLVDLDGVLYRGAIPLPRAQDFIVWLQDRRITFRLVTNNATLTPEQYRDKLAMMGIVINAREVFTSALATSLYLKEEGQAGRSAYVIGEDGIRQAVEDAGLEITADKPDWVVVGLDRQLTYEKLAVASLAIGSGARFLGTNPDTSFPNERGLVPGAGAIQAAITATTGVTPKVIGKPQPLMLKLAMADLGGSNEDTAMLGDRLDTDIAGAIAAGMPSILVLTGVSTREDLVAGSIQPTLVAANLEELMAKWPIPAAEHR
jgi:4-nitrophenyl phosphatase